MPGYSLPHLPFAQYLKAWKALHPHALPESSQSCQHTSLPKPTDQVKKRLNLKFMFPALTALIATNIFSLYKWIDTHNASKRKANAEAELTELSATQKIIKLYQDLSDDIRCTYENKLKDFRVEIDELKAQVSSLIELKCNNTKCENRQK